MEYRTVPGVNKPVSRLVQGTVTFGSSDAEKAFQLLDDVLAIGCNTFDTAHVYGNGESERLIGRWLETRGVREQVVIITKGAHPNQDRPERVTPFDIASDLHDSLARLRVDSIDLYLLHRDNPAIPVGPLVESLNEHLAAGRIHAYGVSNWTHERIEEALEYAFVHDLKPIVASSPNFSLAEQRKPPWEGCISVSGPQGKEAREWYRAAQMPLFTWSSLAGGFFSGRFRRDNLDTFDSYWDRICVEAYASEENFQRLDRLQELAEQKGLTVPQVALAYVLNQPLNIFALVSARNREEFVANAAAVNIRLSAAEMAWLELESATMPSPS
jgi:aryl-alcohol dehydrogenase-like predicted oxidoreductase